jgi:hypothetical protein
VGVAVAVLVAGCGDYRRDDVVGAFERAGVQAHPVRLPPTPNRPTPPSRTLRPEALVSLVGRLSRGDIPMPGENRADLLVSSIALVYVYQSMATARRVESSLAAAEYAETGFGWLRRGNVIAIFEPREEAKVRRALASLR